MGTWAVLLRSARTMAAARATLDFWDAEAPLAVNVREHEDRNLLLLARAILAQAGARRESRGAHYRRDLPGSDERQARSRTLLLSAEREVAGAC
jgi:L-aspartate oxidase